MAVSAGGKFQYPTGRDGAQALGYDNAILDRAGADLLSSFCGVGNPFSLGSINAGDWVLDFGCGAGFDLFVAAAMAGKNGRACGIDLTSDMVERARRNLQREGITNAEVSLVDADVIPYRDGMLDVVISNGVINLCADKKICFQEIFRVLKPGGRLQFADVVLERELPVEMAKSADAWSR